MKKRIIVLFLLIVLLQMTFSFAAENKITTSAVGNSWFASIINFFKGLFGGGAKGALPDECISAGCNNGEFLCDFDGSKFCKTSEAGCLEGIGAGAGTVVKECKDEIPAVTCSQFSGDIQECTQNTAHLECVWDANACKTSCPAGKIANVNKQCETPAPVDNSCNPYTSSGQQRCKEEGCVWDANACKISCPAGKIANANNICKSVKLKSVINNPTSSKKNTESRFSAELDNEAEFKNNLLIASVLINEETSEILVFKYEIINFTDLSKYSPLINYYIPGNVNKIGYKVFVLNSFTDLTSLLDIPISQSYDITA